MLYSLNSGMPVCPACKVETDISKTVCISGHRDKFIIPYQNENSGATVFAVRKMLFSFIDIAVNRGFDTFISGLAEGTDLQAAEYICSIKSEKNLKLICAMPFLKHSQFFKPAYLRILEKAEKNADVLTAVNIEPQMKYGKNISEFSSPFLYRERNHFMVENSSEVVAFLNNNIYRSGTYQTVSYARRKGKIIHSFGIDDIYRIMDKTGTDKQLIINEINTMSEYLYDIP